MAKANKKAEENVEVKPVAPTIQPSVRAIPKLVAVSVNNNMATIKSPDGNKVTMNRERAEKFVRKNQDLGYQLID